MANLPMRILFLLLLSCLSVGATPHSRPPTISNHCRRPPQWKAVPDDEPEVTIIKKTDQTVEEYRVGGRLYMIKIIPKVGKPYYLVDDQGDGKFSRQESLDSGLRPPRWVIHRF